MYIKRFILPTKYRLLGYVGILLGLGSLLFALTGVRETNVDWNTVLTAIGLLILSTILIVYSEYQNDNVLLESYLDHYYNNVQARDKAAVHAIGFSKAYLLYKLQHRNSETGCEDVMAALKELYYHKPTSPRFKYLLGEVTKEITILSK